MPISETTRQMESIISTEEIVENEGNPSPIAKIINIKRVKPPTMRANHLSQILVFL